MAFAWNFGTYQQTWTRQGHAGRRIYTVADQNLLRLVLDTVHPGFFKNHPPSPLEIARKGEFIGLGTVHEFFKEV